MNLDQVSVNLLAENLVDLVVVVCASQFVAGNLSSATQTTPSAPLSSQCDQIGRFWKVVGKKIITKLPKCLENCFWKLRKGSFLIITALATLWATFGKLDYFLFYYLVTLKSTTFGLSSSIDRLSNLKYQNYHLPDTIK